MGGGEGLMGVVSRGGEAHGQGEGRGSWVW